MDGVLYPRAGDARRVHGAQRDDLRVSRITPTGIRSPTSPGIRRGGRITCAHTSNESRTAGIAGGNACSASSADNPSRHGWGGWLTTERAIPLTALKDGDLRTTILKSAKDALSAVGGPLGDRARIESQEDPNDWRVVSESAIGLRYAPMTTRQPYACGHTRAAAGHPEPVSGPAEDRAQRPRHAGAVRRHEPGHRSGVLSGERLYRAHAKPNDAAGAVRQARASREVVLAGGAFNTPQLLMLSGIGPRAELEAHRIPVRVDLPGVGQNLQDRYEVAVVNRMSFDAWEALRGATFTRNDPQFREWTSDRRGVFTTNGVVLSVIARSTNEQPEPDLFCYGLIGNFQGYFPGYSTLVAKNPNCFTWVVLKGHTNNTAGTVTLRSADPRDAPIVNFNYFDEGNDSRRQDVDAVVKGVQLVRQMAGELKRRGLAKEELPGEATESPEAIAECVRNNAWGHHASCTCPIGAQERGGVLSAISRSTAHGPARRGRIGLPPRPRPLHRQRGLHDWGKSRGCDREGSFRSQIDRTLSQRQPRPRVTAICPNDNARRIPWCFIRTRSGVRRSRCSRQGAAPRQIRSAIRWTMPSDSACRAAAFEAPRFVWVFSRRLLKRN